MFIIKDDIRKYGNLMILEALDLPKIYDLNSFGREIGLSYYLKKQKDFINKPKFLKKNQELDK